MSLSPVAKERYCQKLKILGLDEKCDPYLDAGYVNDMMVWPPVEFGHIFCYFIERPGLYTMQELMQWKSLEAYNYFFEWACQANCGEQSELLRSWISQFTCP